MKKLWVGLALVMGCVGGCRPKGAVAVPLAVSVQRPSNVAFLVDVSSGGEPAAGLPATAFSITEDGQALDPAASHLTLLDTNLAMDTGTLLLVDATAKDEERGKALAVAASRFVTEVRRTQPVWVYVFDGNEEIFQVAAFEPEEAPEVAAGDKSADATGDDKSADAKGDDKSADAKGDDESADAKGDDEAAKGNGADEKGDRKGSETALLPELDALAKAATPDVSRNLNGALVKALEQLDGKLAASTKPVRVGSLVVLVSGPDTAGRVPQAQVEAAVEQTRHALYGVGGGQARLRDFARAGAFEAEDGQHEEALLERAAARIVSAHGSRYLLSYCSPGRRGRRAVTVDVDLQPAGLKGSGAFEAEYFADGFADDCDANDKPRFVVTMAYGPNGPVPMAIPGEASAAADEASSAAGGSSRAKPSGAPRASPKPRAARKPAAASAPKPTPAPKPAAKPPAPDGFEP